MSTIKKTKIICTIGPASNNEKTLRDLINNGMSIARLNFSHGEYSEHLKIINLVRSLETQMHKNIGVMLDTKGPEIRLHLFENGKAEIKKGSIIKIYSKEILGDATKFSVNYPNFYSNCKVGQIIKIDDGKFLAKITKKLDDEQVVVCKAINTHVLSNRKGVNIIGGRLNMPFLSDKDREDIKFGCQNGIDFIAASFVRRKEDVLELKALLNELNHNEVLIISKIESAESLSKIDSIINESDGIMVARGDLGVEVEPEQVPIIQIDLINKCRKKGKPVIVATQMLESMQKEIRPTRAEVNDVALAIFQGADSVMLSGESASGLYPVESTAMQKNIALTVEKNIDYKENLSHIILENNFDPITSSAVLASISSNAKLIIVFDEEGRISKNLSKFRPNVPVICLTTKVSLARQLSLFWGIITELINVNDKPIEVSESDIKFYYVNQIVKKYGIKKSSVILIREKHNNNFEMSEKSIRILEVL